LLLLLYNNNNNYYDTRVKHGLEYHPI